MIGTRDDIHWDRASQVPLYTGAITDGWMGIHFDPSTRTYVSYCRPRDRYESGALISPGDRAFTPHASGNFDIYASVVRRIGSMERGALWQTEKTWPRTVLLPDETDFQNAVTALMNMKVKWHGGVYLGFLTPFVPKDQVWTDLVFSRDGKSFQCCPQALIANGPAGAWDSRQAWAMPEWAEVGDEWWIPYWGADTGPNTPYQENAVRAIGITKLRKEGFFSLRTPSVGGVIVMRLLRWPGGDLFVNCDTATGELRVRVSDRYRRALGSFNYADCTPLAGSGVRQCVAWGERALASQKGGLLRLEFHFSKQADLYAFQAGTADE